MEADGGGSPEWHRNELRTDLIRREQAETGWGENYVRRKCVLR